METIVYPFTADSVQTERELSLREERRREHPETDPAAPAPGRKLLIEFACEPDSRLSAVMMECGGEAIRVHIGSFDITKAKDVSQLIAIIEDNPGCDVWASIPCGPWSTWQYVNLSIHGAEFASHLNDGEVGAGLHSSGLDTALDGSNRSCRGFLLILMSRP